MYMNDKLKEYAIKIELPILWGHMDAFNHVNNIIYFRFFESVRIAYFEEVGFLEAMRRIGIGPILAATSCKYISPLTYPDTISIGAKTSRLEGDNFDMDYKLVSSHKDTVAALGDAKVVSYDYRKQKMALIPNEVKEKIIQLEKGL